MFDFSFIRETRLMFPFCMGGNVNAYNVNAYRAAIAATLLIGLSGATHAENTPYPFDQYKLEKKYFRTSECGSYFANIFDKGPYTASCRIFQLSHMIGMGDTTKRRFEAVSCARGDSEIMANSNARGHARHLINMMQIDDLKARGS